MRPAERIAAAVMIFAISAPLVACAWISGPCAVDAQPEGGEMRCEAGGSLIVWPPPRPLEGIRRPAAPAASEPQP